MRFNVIALLIALAFSSPAQAARRIAVLVSNNSADPSREELRYAERDAREMQRVLSTLGGVRTAYVLSEDTPDALRATWKQVERDAAGADEPVMLFFFYSGHADERGLLMGAARYDFSELRASLEK